MLRTPFQKAVQWPLLPFPVSVRSSISRRIAVVRVTVWASLLVPYLQFAVERNG